MVTPPYICINSQQSGDSMHEYMIRTGCNTDAHICILTQGSLWRFLPLFAILMVFSSGTCWFRMKVMNGFLLAPMRFGWEICSRMQRFLCLHMVLTKKGAKTRKRKNVTHRENPHHSSHRRLIDKRHSTTWPNKLLGSGIQCTCNNRTRRKKVLGGKANVRSYANSLFIFLIQGQVWQMGMLALVLLITMH